MILKDLAMVVLPVGNVYIFDKDENPLKAVRASDMSIMADEILDKEVLSITPSYTLAGDRLIGCLRVNIDCDFI